MPATPHARRVRAAGRRTVRKSGAPDAFDRIGRHKGFSHQAFIAVTLVGVVGFVTVLCQFYRAISSERGIDIGGLKFRLRTRLTSLPPAADLATTSKTQLPLIHDAIPIVHDAVVPAVTSLPSATSNFQPPLEPSPRPEFSRARTLLSDGRAEKPSPTQPAHTPLPEPHCKWREHNSQYLGEFAVPGVPEGGEEEAKTLCLQQGDSCGGVTCTFSRLKCSARRGTPYLAGSPEGEISFTYDCPKGGATQSVGSNPVVSDELHALPPDFAVSELDRSSFKLAAPGNRQPLGVGRAGLVVIAHNRPDCVRKCLGTIVNQDDARFFTLAVSLDDPPTFDVMENAVNEFRPRQQIMTWRKPVEALKTAVQKIAAHFRFALTKSFEEQHFEFTIFLENDLTLAPDALWYFRSTAWLLEEDPSLFCVSAWNDNGFRGLVSDEKRLFRTDYFPGLGWMIHSDTWNKIRSMWPANPTTGWDHWLRHGSGLRPRECIVPEVPRTHHFDTKGTNVKAGSAIIKVLEKMVESKLPPGELRDLSYLLADRYEAEVQSLLRKSDMTSITGLDMLIPERSYILPYVREEYKSISTKLQIYGAQARTAHRGMVITRHPTSQATVILVNRRQGAGALPETEQWTPHPQRKIGAAAPGQNCDMFCGRHQMRCEAREIEFINHCSVLRRHFPCENGCGHQVGLEIPCYVHNRGAETALQCLVTDDVIPTCGASHRSTSRICACVPAFQ